MFREPGQDQSGRSAVRDPSTPPPQAAFARAGMRVDMGAVERGLLLPEDRPREVCERALPQPGSAGAVHTARMRLEMGETPEYLKDGEARKKKKKGAKGGKKAAPAKAAPAKAKGAKASAKGADEKAYRPFSARASIPGGGPPPDLDLPSGLDTREL